MNRRGFLSSILALAAAPAIVRADSLMRIVPVDTDILTFASMDIVIDQGLRPVLLTPERYPFQTIASVYAKAGPIWERHTKVIPAGAPVIMDLPVANERFPIDRRSPNPDGSQGVLERNSARVWGAQLERAVLEVAR